MKLVTPPIDRSPTLCAEDIMVCHPPTARPDQLAMAAAEHMNAHNVHGLPVVDTRRRLIGVITLTDCLNLITMDPSPPGPASARVEHLMTPDVHHILPNTGLLTAAHILRQHPWHMLPVVDRGVLVGTITGREVLQGAARVRAELTVDRTRMYPDYLRPGQARA